VDITEVRIKLMDDPNDRLQGFCSITFDGCFVIRDLKIIQGTKGAFVAMPSRKLTDRCGNCGTKNHLRARFCNDCGAQLEEERAIKDDDGRAKLYADIAHPINSGCRDMIQSKVLESFEREKVHAHKPGYVCSYDDYGEDRIAKATRRDIEPSPSRRIVAPDNEQRRVDSPQSEPSRPHLGSERPKTSTRSERDTFGAGVD
jgi:stage V sporulation protein G